MGLKQVLLNWENVMKKQLVAAILGVAFLGCASGVTKQPEKEKKQVESAIKDRTVVPSKYKWDKSHLFKTEKDMRKAYDEAVALLEKFESYKGKFGEKEELKGFLSDYHKVLRTFYNVYSYASRVHHVSMSDTEGQKLMTQAKALEAKIGKSVSFVDSEILSLPSETVEGYMNDPEMKQYRRFLHHIVRKSDHALSEKEEKLLATFSAFEYASSDAFETFTNVEIPNTFVTLSDGKKVELSEQVYAVNRSLENRADRKLVFDTYWKNYDQFKNTLTKNLYYQTKFYELKAQSRNYKNALEEKMVEKELDLDFYDKLIANINGILPAMHEYVELRKDMLGVDKVRAYDMYVSINPYSYEKRVPYEEGTETIMKAMDYAGMIDEYKNAMAEGMKPGNGWVDVYPNKGKRGGAYMSGFAVDSHPFILLNYMDTYDSMSTLAHEMGHAMQSYFSNKYQSFENAHYNLFTAEVASIFNEIILINYAIDNAKSKEEKIYLLNEFVEMVRGTVFRQALFAEFERELHRKVENGEAPTADELSALYKKITEKYYGAEKGLYEMDSLHALEWVYVPHFYYDYYVFQYVVGYVGALSFATNVMEKKMDPVQYVDNFLKQGSSKPPLQILKDAGVDMTSPEPYKLTERIFRKRLGELRKLLKEKNSK